MKNKRPGIAPFKSVILQFHLTQINLIVALARLLPRLNKFRWVKFPPGEGCGIPGADVINKPQTSWAK